MWIYRGIMLLIAGFFALAAVGEAVSDHRHAGWVEVPGDAVDTERVRLFAGGGRNRSARPSPQGVGAVSRYNVTVRYEVDGRFYRHRRTNLWRRLPESDPVPVFHHPDDPNRATLSDPRVYSSWGIAGVMAVFLLLSLLPRRVVDRLTLLLLGERPDAGGAQPP